MIKSIGFVELNSIARGIEVADFMIKAATVDLIFAKSVCPGKYIIMISGDVGAIRSSMAVGSAKGGAFVVDSFQLNNLDEQVVRAINAVTEIDEPNAVGAVEYFSVAEAVLGADAACKAADIQVMEIRLGIAIGGKSFFTITGSVSDVEAAVNAAVYAGEDRGMVVSHCVIPSPTPELFNSLM